MISSAAVTVGNPSLVVKPVHRLEFELCSACSPTWIRELASGRNACVAGKFDKTPASELAIVELGVEPRLDFGVKAELRAAVVAGCFTSALAVDSQE